MRSSIIGLAAATALSWAGSARAGTVFKPSLQITAEERYDSDILLRQEAQAGGELLSKLTPQLGLEGKDERWDVKAWYAPDVMFHHGSGTVSFDHRGELSVKHRFGHRLNGDGDLQIWRVTDPTSLPRLGLAKTLAPVLYGRAELGMSYSLSERWLSRVGVKGEAAHVYEANSVPGYVVEPYAQAMYRLTRRANAGVEYQFSYFHFGDESANAHGIFGRWTYRLSRELTVIASGGPNFYTDATHPDSSGIVPHVLLELQRAGPRLDWGLAVGHDLVGASGFTAALWADYASLMAGYRLTETVKLTGVASFFRNGKAPNVNAWSFALNGQGLDSGYAAGVGVEWQFSRILAAKATVDRYAQVANPLYAGQPDLSRNVFALRLIATAF